MKEERMEIRLIIKAGDHFYYDIGVRCIEDPHNVLSKINNHKQFGEHHPRYLEDFIEFYGKKNVEVMSYGKLKDNADMIQEILQ